MAHLYIFIYDKKLIELECDDPMKLVNNEHLIFCTTEPTGLAMNFITVSYDVASHVLCSVISENAACVSTCQCILSCSISCYEMLLLTAIDEFNVNDPSGPIVRFSALCFISHVLMIR